MTGKDPGRTGVREGKQGNQKKLPTVHRGGCRGTGESNRRGGGKTDVNREIYKIIYGRVALLYHESPPPSIPSTNSRTGQKWLDPKCQQVGRSVRGGLVGWSVSKSVGLPVKVQCQ